MSKKLKAAVIGLTIGYWHANDYVNDPNISEVVICDLDVEKLKKAGDELGIEKRYTDYVEMLETEKPDIVSVCVSNFLHRQICTEAFRQGADVLCEKPLARSEEECREIMAAAEKYGKRLMVNFNRRYNPESIALKKLIENGDLGEIYYATTSWKRVRGVPWWYPLNNTKEKCGGGAFIDLGVHMLDLCMWLCGYPEADHVLGKTFQKVSADEAKNRGFENFDAEDMGVAMISMKNGMMLETEISWASNSELEGDLIELRLYGTKGGAVIKEECYSRTTALFIKGTEDGTEVKPIVTEEGSESIRGAFVRAILNETAIPCLPEEAASIAKIMDAVYTSSRECRPVSL